MPVPLLPNPLHSMQMCSVASGRGKMLEEEKHHNQQQNFWMYCGDPYEAAVSLYSMICSVLRNCGTVDINVPQFAELFFMPCASFIIHQLFRHKYCCNQRTCCCMYVEEGRIHLFGVRDLLFRHSTHAFYPEYAQMLYPGGSLQIE